jgi:hypothetical protein
LKNVLDCLYPILGGLVGAPHDERIVSLEASKGNGIGGTVQVDVFEVAQSKPPT